MIHARELTRDFTANGATVQAVKGIDIDVAEGELVGFLGPNGAGKTTTLRMLATLLRPTGGTATVAGKDLMADPVGVRRRIGYVAQQSGVSPDLKVAEELEGQGMLYGMSRAEARRRGATLMDQLGLDGLDQRPTKTLSGGQRRRLDIALGLIHDPVLIFLDEPSTALDPQSRANLWDHIRRLRAEQNITVFLTTHYLDEADALADRLLVIDHGGIVAEGAPSVLKAEVSGDAVTLDVDPAHAPRAAALADDLDGATEVAVTGGTVSFRVPHGNVALPLLLRALDAAGISTSSLRVQQPTLDDVFLTMTGRSLRDAPQPALGALNAA